MPEVQPVGSVQTSAPEVGGMFEFGPAEQASKDAEKVIAEQPEEKAQPSVKPENPAPVEQTEPEIEEQVDDNNDQVEAEVNEVEGEEKEGQQDEPKPIAFRNRTFKTVDEVLENLGQSYDEGMRLNGLLKEKENLEKQLVFQLLDSEVKAYEKYPGEKTDDELAAMPPHLVTKYYHDKDKWETKRESVLAKHEAAKKSIADWDVRVKQEIADSEKTLSTNPTDYPKYSELADLRKDVLTKSPFLANRPEANYISYYIAYGIFAHKRDQEAAKLSAASKNKAASVASAASSQTDKAGNGRTNKSPVLKKKDDAVRGMVNAWNRNKF